MSKQRIPGLLITMRAETMQIKWKWASRWGESKWPWFQLVTRILLTNGSSCSWSTVCSVCKT
uniref:Uncharacterized protein n=1 Tax=Kalanchoe fedtschenkoi TaxID=63787 RepID=A0A7N1A9U9_KALFE